MPQVRSVVSETLQATIRRLLPSQAGFTEDLHASNVITPIIDLTPASEGSDLAIDLRRALSFQGITQLHAINTTVVAADTPGFWRVFGHVDISHTQGQGYGVDLWLDNGQSNKWIWSALIIPGVQTINIDHNLDVVVFLAPGERLTIQSNSANAQFRGCVRQIADANGMVVNPGGYSPQ